MLGSLQSVPLGKGPKKSLGNSLGELSKNILSNNIDSITSAKNNIFISPNFPRFICKFILNYQWNP
ncbi:hypothetical protein [Clostridioides difficile]|uniref:hypothetical protein n=1 Tax=Clostridioides difficile TaxID=1496 RepID=UPI003057980B|nr:hypothetical protein [Clostridioides difficile]